MNVREMGNGFDFGHFDADRNFIPSGHGTTHTAITMRPGSAANSITVVVMDTNNVLFEFTRGDFGGNFDFGVMPRPIAYGNPETWFRGNRYNGGFEYIRQTDGNLTIVNVVELEDYIKGVVPYEMVPTWPIEALKAQAVTARTFVLRRINFYRTQGFDVCRTEHCQVYRGRERANENTDRAVRETAGVVVTVDGQLVGTYYASSNGGASENSENVWVTAYSHLRGVIDPFEAQVAHRIPGYHWEITFTPAQITQRLRDRGFNVSTIVSMEVSQYSPTGNVIAVTMRDNNGTSWTFRRRGDLINALGVRTQRFDIGNRRWDGAPATGGGIYVNSGNRIGQQPSYHAIRGDGTVVTIPSGSMYAVNEAGVVERITPAPSGQAAATNCNGMINGVFTIRGTGNGHNVGMSQWGAYAMARYHNKSYVDIIQFYFRGVTVG